MARLKRVPAGATQCGDTTQDVAAVQPTKPHRFSARTSSERGKAFRERRAKRQVQLEQQVARLRQEIQDKSFLLNVHGAKCLRTRHSVQGSLVALAVDYFRTFHFGLQPPARANSRGSPHQGSDLIQRQEACVYSIMDPDVVIGTDLRGPEAELQQWRRHTQALEGFWCEVASPPTVLGAVENPIIHLQLQGGFAVSPHFVNAFVRAPARARASRLLQSCMNKKVPLSCRVNLQFSAENRITWKIMQADYAQSFVDLGLAMGDVAELLSISRLTLHSTIEPL